MLKKLKLAAIALLLPLIAFAQSYPSPTFNNVTVQGTLSVTGAPAFTVPVPVASGGTGKTSVTANTLLYGAGTAALNTLGPLTNGQLVVGSTGAAPVAATLTGTTNQVNVTNGAGTITLSTPQNIDSTASPTFAGLSLSTTPLGVASGGTGAATQSAALSNILGSSTISVANGGTGRATLTSHAALVGAGTSGITQVAPSTAGQALISAGATSDPVWGYPTGTLIGVQRFTSSGTYTPTAGTNSIVVEVQGGGGAGGGGPATGAGQCSAGAGGYSGAYAKTRLTSGFSGATVTVGSGGTGASGAAGGSGGNSAFGTVTANGGPGGAINGPSGATNNNNFSTPPTAANGSIVNISGTVGAPSYCSNSTGQVLAGIGASSLLGSGGIGAAGGTGGAASGFGAGGGGAVQNTASSGALTGGAGSGGIVIVWEYN